MPPATPQQLAAQREALARLPRTKPKRGPDPYSTESLEAEYTRSTTATVSVLRSLVDRLFVPRISDMTATQARGVTRDIKARWSRITRGPLAADAATVAAKTDRLNDRSTKNQMQELTGLDVNFSDDGVDQEIDDFAERGVALMENTATVALEQTREQHSLGLAKGLAVAAIAAAIFERLDVANSRARLIGEDQVQKFFGSATERRHRELGIEEYFWRTSRDERVRPEHAAREGKKFEWSDPPFDGHPGQPVRCRCHSDPVIPGLTNIRTTPAMVPRAAAPTPRPRRAPAELPTLRRRPPRAPAPVTPAIQKLTRQQAERASLSARLLKSETERAAATGQERREHLLWQWVNGAKRKTSIMLKAGVKRAFGRRAPVYNPRGFVISEADIARTARDAQDMYDATQQYLRQRGVERLTLYRGVKDVDGLRAGVIESWSMSEDTARKFGPVVQRKVVPAKQILAMRGGPDWMDGPFGDQQEVIVIR